MAPDTCPNCGAEVPDGAKSCPECGACENTGWSDEAYVSGLDLPDESFDYNEFVKREFEGKPSRARRITPLWWVVAVLLLVGILFLIVRPFIPF